MSTDIFTQAVRQKIRFSSPKGDLSAEELWDLPLTSAKGHANLDDIAKALHCQLKSSDDVSFVTPVVSATAGIQLKFDIVKFVIDTRIAEREAAQAAATRSEQRQKVLSILARKQDGALEEMSPEDLQKLADSLK